MTLTGEIFVENMSAAERDRAAMVERVLPALRDHADDVDKAGEFYMPHVKTLSNAGLLGLMVPEQYGGLGGGLRDLCAATFAMGSACPSTALCYYFQCSATSRGTLLLKALEQNLFNAEEAAKVTQWAELLLNLIGREGKWMGNFTSENVKTEKAKITVETVASKVDGGYQLNGVKSFACAYGVADYYLVTANLEGHDDIDGMCTFIVDSSSAGLDRRIKWDALGMRGSATDGLVMKDVFVSDEYSLPIVGAFKKSMDMSRGSFVGNQMAGGAVYLGIAYSVYEYILDQLKTKTFKDTGKPYGTGPMYQQLLGEMMTDLHTAMLWLRRQLELETAEPPLLPKDEVVKLWRLCKGQVAESGFKLATNALKAAGTGGALSSSLTNRAIREMAMGIVQAYPAERGKLDAANTEIIGSGETLFAGHKKSA
ncbi:acyl-CoA dehydrogenase family protein [Oceanicoccus sp. KOV_DT_Chl]|uniref:acyl-CoA dehydrogenase family protein n=1 Tax=Oceanicoccus sp. KOV_DT_Chl TaxID=1904639 RepID=UPI000C7A7E67|nr:acyl-CoA dehydrogenase family protein [Oceanicoccus sp. KOV_DT_Chl]